WFHRWLQEHNLAIRHVVVPSLPESERNPHWEGGSDAKRLMRLYLGDNPGMFSLHAQHHLFETSGQILFCLSTGPAAVENHKQSSTRCMRPKGLAIRLVIP